MTNRELRELFGQDHGAPALDPYAGSLWTPPAPIRELEDEPEEHVQPAPAPQAAPERPLAKVRLPRAGTLRRDLLAALAVRLGFVDEHAFAEALAARGVWPCRTAAARCVRGVARVRIPRRPKC